MAQAFLTQAVADQAVSVLQVSLLSSSRSPNSQQHVAAQDHEGCEGQHWEEGDDKGCPRQGDRRGVRVEGQESIQGHQQPRCHCHEGGDDGWAVQLPGALQDQEPHEASDQGHREENVRQGVPRESAPGAHYREGIPRGGLETERLSLKNERVSHSVILCMKRGAPVVSSSATLQVLRQSSVEPAGLAAEPRRRESWPYIVHVTAIEERK